MDDAQLQILQTFEQACLNLQQPGKEKDAEKLILEFRKLPNALSLCRILLERSNSTSVQFHAVLALREIILRDWTLISVEDKHSLRTYLLSYVITRTTSNTIDYVVQKQALQTVAILSKRGWFDGEVTVMAEQRGALFQQIQQVLEVTTAANGTSILYKLQETPPTNDSKHFVPIQHQQSIAVRRVGIMTLSFLVDEFTYNKSNSIGLSWEYHHKCFQAFQKGELRSVFLLAWKSLCSSYFTVASAQSNDNNTGIMKDNMNLLKDALSLVLQVLSWKFDETPLDKVNVSFQHQHGESSNVLKPGPSWRDIFTDGDLIEHFFLLYQSLRSIPDIAHQLLECIQQLSSINGKIFLEEKYKTVYISKLLSGLTGLISLCISTNVQQTMTSSLREYYIVELTDIANIIQRLTTNFKLNSLLHLPDKIQQFLLEATQFTTHTLQLIIFYVTACKGANSKIDFDSEELTQLEDILDVLLEAWVVLLGDENEASTVNLHTYIKDFTSNIFQGYVQSRLAIANFAMDDSEVEEEDTPDEIKYDEQLVAVAYLGRLDAGNALNCLLKLLNSKVTPETFPSILGNPSALEELHWLVLISGHLLCDGGVGEIPRIPSSINILSKSCHSVEMDPVLSLCTAIFGIITYENEFLNANKQSSLSPLLAKTLVWFLNRWCKSYLLIDNNNYSPHILLSYGTEVHGGKGIQILDAMLWKIHINLHKWNAEFDVIKETLGLLTTLGDMRQVPAIIGTSKLPSWFELLFSYASSDARISQLQPVLHRTLIANLIRICDNMVSKSVEGQRGNLEEVKKQQAEYFGKIVTPVSSQLTSLLQQPNFVSISQNYQVLSKIMILLEQLRGIARCTISDDSAIFVFCKNFLPALIRLIPIYKDCPEVLIVILQLYCDLAEFQLEFISSEQCQEFYVSVGELLNTFVTAIGNQKLVIKSSKTDEQQQAYKDLKTIMKLLYLICYHTNVSEDAQSVIFFGINLIMNFITPDLLDFPKLSKYYFELMNSLFDACPGKIAMLEPRLFRNLVSSLQFGIQHHESELSRKSLEAFQNMCRYHVQHKIDSGSFGLAPQQQQDPQLVPNLLKFVMNYILFQDFNADMLDSASATLLCLICAENQEYTNLVQAFVTQQQIPEVKERLSNAFVILSSNIQLNLERKNMEQFVKNMQQFVQRVKSILLTK